MKENEIYKKLQERYKQAVKDLIDEIPDEWIELYKLEEEIPECYSKEPFYPGDRINCPHCGVPLTLVKFGDK